MRTRMVTALALALALAVPAAARTHGDARKAAWLSVAHPGLGEYSNAGWGPFFDRCPQKKFWLGLIPVYGWPGDLQILSAIHASPARTAVERRIAANPRFAAIDRAVGAEGRKIVFLLRLSPVFPFNLLNYALGLTRVRFADYFLASAGMLPGTVLYVYSGKLLGDVTALAGGASVEKGAGYYAVLVLGLAATVAVTTVVTRTARRALGEATGA